MKKITSFLAMSALAASSAFAAVPAGFVLAQEWTAEKPLVCEKAWSTILEVPGAAFENVCDESYFVMHFTDCEGGQVQMAFKDGDWTWTAINDYTDIVDGIAEMSIAGDGEGDEYEVSVAAEWLPKHGMNLKGQNFTLTGIDTYNPSTYKPVNPLEGYELTSTYTLGTPIEGSWSGENSVPSAAFKSVNENSVLRLNFTDVAADGQIQIAYKADNSGWTWTELSQYEDLFGKDNYILPVSAFADPADAAAGLKAHGLFVKGQGYTLVSVDVFNIAGSVEPEKKYAVTYSWEPAAPMVCEKSWSTIIEVPASAFKTLTTDSKVRLLFTDCTGGQIQPVVKLDDADWTWTELVQYVDIEDNMYEVTMPDAAQAVSLTAEDIVAAIAAHGFFLKGQKFTLTGVEVLNPEGTPVEPVTELEVVDTWTPAEPMVCTKAWSTIIEIPAVAFAKSTVESTVRLHFTDCAGGQVQIAYKADDADFTWTQFNDYDDIADNRFEIEMAKTDDPADAVAGLKANGMYLKGQNFTFTKVEILNPKSTSGVSNVSSEKAAIDWNAPVEIYTVSGVRVSEMTRGNLYIVRQGATVAKVVK